MTRQVATLPRGTYLRNSPIRGLRDDEWLLPIHMTYHKYRHPKKPGDPARVVSAVMSISPFSLCPPRR
jgi:hypothetical protein